MPKLGFLAPPVLQKNTALSAVKARSRREEMEEATDIAEAEAVISKRDPSRKRKTLNDLRELNRAKATS